MMYKLFSHLRFSPKYAVIKADFILNGCSIFHRNKNIPIIGFTSKNKLD